MSCVKTTLAKNETFVPSWYVLDADGMIVGRLATKLAMILMGKHKPTYTSHVDTGDYIVVLNADRVRFSGTPLSHSGMPYYTQKTDEKEYQHYTGYPSGLRREAAAEVWHKHPTKILSEAVRRMLPKNKLGRKMLRKLKLVVGTNHSHQAQNPQELPAHLRP